MTKSNAQKKYIKPRSRKSPAVFISHGSDDGKKLLEELRQSIRRPAQTPLSQRTVFISHGHDLGASHSVKDFVTQLGLRPLLLQEQPSMGRTIIEKFEDSDVDFAIILLTSDDLVTDLKKKQLAKPRARQNVIFEFGYLVGRLGRNRVCALYKEGVEIPSDYQGVLYIPMDSAGAWRMAFAKEIKNAGIDVDLNKVV